MQGRLQNGRQGGRGNGCACWRGAFTLIELLVVMAIISLLMALALPSLGKARRTARATVGVANLRSLSQVMLTYTNNQHNQFLNPYGKLWAERQDNPDDPPIYHATISAYTDPTISWDMSGSDQSWLTEAFAYSWYSYVSEWYGNGRVMPEMFSPADAELLAMKSTLGGGTLTAQGRALWPSSFLYSPTMWTSWERYPVGARRKIQPAFMRTITTDTVTFPSAKVFLWERADFSLTSRPSASGPTNLPPAWNNPRAGINVVTCDGSVSKVAVRDLMTLAASDDPSHAMFLPGGTFAAPDVPELRLDDASVGAASQADFGGSTTTDDEYPLFFWATQNGAHGRDLPR